MPYFDPLTRRRFLIATGAILNLGPSSTAAEQKLTTDPFTLGVASGDPAPDGFVLWTRLAPDPLNGGGMPPENFSVEWQVSADEGFARVLKSGRAIATPQLAHSVHVEVRGLEPARWYFYRFRASGMLSPVGRSRTAPARNAKLDKLSFTFASCQHYEHGYYTAYQHMAEEDIDLVVHLGDYIYEGAAAENRIRRHNSAEITSLNDYRNRYALYKSEPLLQKAHARFPWIVTWDDHEVDNNYAADMAEDGAPRAAFLERRANAYQAYYEHMPLRTTSLPKGSHMLLYRRLTFGDLAEFSVLDTRQYRTDQPCGDGNKPQCSAALDERATMLGPGQEQWVMNGLTKSRVRWDVIAQQVMMAKVDRRAGPEEAYAMDQWSGYEIPRRRILDFLSKRRPNAIVITGDIHSNWAADLKADFSRPESAVVASEFVGTSISSGGDGSDTQPAVDAYLPENPHVKFYNTQRGYVRCVVTPGEWRTDYRVVPYVTKPGAAIQTRASFLVENGHPGIRRV